MLENIIKKAAVAVLLVLAFYGLIGEQGSIEDVTFLAIQEQKQVSIHDYAPSENDEVLARNIKVAGFFAALLAIIIIYRLLKRNKETYGKFSFYGGWAFKLAMLAFGIAGLLGYFNLTGKLLSAFLLFLMWVEFSPSKFLFGAKKKWVDYFLLVSLYIFIIDTFTRIIQTANYDHDALNTILFYLSILPEQVSQSIIDASMYAYTSGSQISLFSANVGFMLISLGAVIISLTQRFDKQSMIYPFVSLFTKKEEFWEGFSSKGLNRYTTIKVCTSLIVLLLFSQYFFSLVNQWFIVTISNSLLIIAIIMNIKDLDNTGIKVVDKLGSLDQELIDLVTKIFNDRQYFIFGFSILLIFHYMSDATLFMMPYFIPTLSLDEYYVSALNQGPHLSLFQLFGSEAISTGVEKVYYFILYLVSSLGLLFLFMVPVMLLFLYVLNKELTSYLEKTGFRIFLYAVFISITIFLLAPWTESLPIIKDSSGQYIGIQGVDFITARISDSGYPLFLLFGALIVLAGIAVIFFSSRKMREYALTITFLACLIFLGKYVWNFYLSTFHYYTYLLEYSLSSHQILLIMLFLMLFVIETVFYIGGFFVVGYYLSRFIITQETKEIMTDKAIMAYTALFFLVPAFLLYSESQYAITSTAIAIASLLVFSFALYREFDQKEKWDDYILGVTISISIFMILVITAFYSRGALSPNALFFFTYLQPIIIIVLSKASLKFFGIILEFEPLKWDAIIKTALIAAIFGIVFYFVPEPASSLIELPFVSMLVYLILVAISEEMLFRGVILELAERAFALDRAIILQAIVFALSHFVGIKAVFAHFGAVSASISITAIYVALYYAALLLFGIAAAYLYKAKRNLAYPVIFHLIVNMIIYL